jgi:hypothetical protein
VQERYRSRREVELDSSEEAASLHCNQQEAAHCLDPYSRMMGEESFHYSQKVARPAAVAGMRAPCKRNKH